VEAPRNPKVHELTSLALFASGDYRAAAGEAHAAMALGTIAEWKDLYAYYNDVNKYTAQLRALEKAVAANPKDAAEHFLLGYQYLMIGTRDNAKIQFADAAKLTPGDKLAAYYLKELQSNAPLAPPEMASRPQGKAM
jgi:Flp pilus assembly protein TadD